MAFDQMHARRRAAEHAGDVVAVPVRHLGGAVHFQHVARGVVDADRAARFHRHAGMAADGEVELDNGVRSAEGAGEIAVGFLNDGGFGRAAVLELAGRIARIEDDGQFLDLDIDQVGGVFGQIGVGREHSRHRLADITHVFSRQDGLAIEREPFDLGQPEVDRRNAGDVGEGPDRDHPRQRQRGAGVDRYDAAVRVRRAHHAHVQHSWEEHVGREPAAAGDQRPILQARNRTADEGHVSIKALRADPTTSCPSLSRASTTFLMAPRQDVDGRDKPGHDSVHVARACIITS